MARRSSASLDSRPSQLVTHGRLIACAIAGAVAGVAWPELDSILAHALVGWNVFVWLYLVVIAIVLVRADEGHIKRFALAQAESAGMVLAIVVSTALMSLLAVIFELIAAKAAGPHHMAGHLVFGAVTVFGSWLLLPTLFALTYASAYYGPDPDRGLAFPDAPRGFEPDHTDFLYFSFTIAVTAQTSDIGVTTRRMRRLVLWPVGAVVRLQHDDPGVLDQRRGLVLLRAIERELSGPRATAARRASARLCSRAGRASPRRASGSARG